MIYYINRFVGSPDSKVQQHIVELFGTEDVLKVVHNSPDRFLALRELYQHQLKKDARFVRYFEMRDTEIDLFIISSSRTNHPLGHVKMKEAF